MQTLVQKSRPERKRYVDERQKILGLRGMPHFHMLSYFKYDLCFIVLAGHFMVNVHSSNLSSYLS